MNENISVRVIWLTAALIAVSSVSPAHAQQNQASSSACYVPGSGTIYLIKKSGTPVTCRAGHVEFGLAPATTTSMAAQAGPNGGGGGSLATNAQGAFDLSNVDGLVAAGTWGTGNIPTAGAGTRLMWYPRKAAFRAGIAAGNQWDDVNIGSGSAALGLSTTASGQNAVAAGTGSLASGNAAFAVGEQSAAIGAAAAALGYKAKASGASAIALGREALAGGFASVALGNGATASLWEDVAIGQGAVAQGSYSTAIAAGKATGNQAVAIGPNAEAAGVASIAIGRNILASGNASIAMGHYASTNGKSAAFVYGDISPWGTVKAAADNQFVVRSQKFWFGTNSAVTATAGRFIETSTGAYLSAGGAWVSSSDSTKKHRWAEVDGEEILSRLSAMPVRSWSYREEGDSVRHLGPTAQDFRSAFGLGDTEKAIATVDADGVSLAGIKALVQRTAALRRENEELRALLGEVVSRLAALETARR
jgi:hypothetical protein